MRVGRDRADRFYYLGFYGQYSRMRRQPAYPTNRTNWSSGNELPLRFKFRCGLAPHA